MHNMKACSGVIFRSRKFRGIRIAHVFKIDRLIFGRAFLNLFFKEYPANDRDRMKKSTNKFGTYYILCAFF